TPEPGEKLLVQRAIEPELVPQLGQFARVDVAALVPANDQQGHVPRDNIHEQKNDQRRPDERRNHQQQTFDNILPHKLPPLSFPSASSARYTAYLQAHRDLLFINYRGVLSTRRPRMMKCRPLYLFFL